MKKHAKPIVALASGAILLSSVLCQTAQAQTTIISSGKAILADTYGTEYGPEALTVTYSVTENASGVYTYNYTVNNPDYDIQIDNPSAPEIFDAFSVVFDPTVTGAYAGHENGGPGSSFQLNGAGGLEWSFNPAIAPGNSAVLSFDSDLPPTMGDANAYANELGNSPPAPWASGPGEEVPVPNVAVPEPATTTLLALTALLLPPFRSTLLRFIGRGENAGL
jgi:hypothetical protein